MFAAGWLDVNTLLIGSTTRELGEIPKLHISVAPLQTCIGIAQSPLSGILCQLQCEGSITRSRAGNLP